ncbi:MAG TPA: hypothetical protein VI455_17365 [Terriglobia bacterium]
MKTMTREQVERMKEKAARFSRDVLDDQQKADEFDDMSVDDYAEHKGIALSNPRKAAKMARTSLREKVEDLEAENDELREKVDEYEARFDDIASSIPEVTEEEDEDDGEEGDG